MSKVDDVYAENEARLAKLLAAMETKGDALVPLPEEDRPAALAAAKADVMRLAAEAAAKKP